MASTTPRDLNKKMRKRKQLNSLMRFNVVKNNTNDIIRSSEDELFIPHRNMSKPKLHISQPGCSWKYSQHILSFILVCSFAIVCFGLIYANFQLKNEVHHLSLRIDEIENKLLNTKLKNNLSVLEKVNTRLSVLEKWNFSFLQNQLQNLQAQMTSNNKNDDISFNQQKIDRQLKDFSQNFNGLNNINQEIEMRFEKMINESIVQWYEQLKLFRNEITSLNKNSQIEDLIKDFERLSSRVNNSSDKTSNVLHELQSNVDKLKVQLDECKCSKELINLRVLTVDKDQLHPTMFKRRKTNKDDKQSSEKSQVP